jgi:sirohydrochlorin cobaltochelatase
MQYSSTTMAVALGNGDSKSECGLLLAGHGTRDERGLAEFHDLARQVAAVAGNFLVEPCFLELAQPDIPAAIGRLVERGVGQIIVAPLMLFAAGHAKRDIPRAVEEAARVASGQWAVGSVSQLRHDLKSNPVTVSYLTALECNPRILELSRQRFDEALAGKPAVDPADTLLLLVARGSSSPEATSMMHRFAELRSKSTAAARVEACFVAKARPSLEESLAQAARSGFRRIVVQPHLLFAGQVLEEVRRAVSAASASNNAAEKHEWIVPQHLGPSPLVASAISEAVIASAIRAAPTGLDPVER